MRPRRYRTDALTRLQTPAPANRGPRPSVYTLVDLGAGVMLPDWAVRLFGPERPERRDDLPF